MRLTVSILIAYAAVFLSECGAQSPVPEQALTTLFVARGPESADTVVIFVQGGPFPDLRPDLVDALPGLSRYRRVTVHQPWTLNADLLASPEDVSLGEATRLNAEALGVLDEVVRYFQSGADAICVVGHSYGALLTLQWMATRRRPVATHVLAGRLLLPDVVWQNFRDGRLYWFPDGETPEPVDGETPRERIVAMRLQADIGRRRFTDLLQGIDLSHLTFVYGDQDRLVGALTRREVEFLTRHGARVVTLRGAGHRAMFDARHEDAMKGVFECRGA